MCSISFSELLLLLLSLNFHCINRTRHYKFDVCHKWNFIVIICTKLIMAFIVNWSKTRSCYSHIDYYWMYFVFCGNCQIHKRNVHFNHKINAFTCLYMISKWVVTSISYSLTIIKAITFFVVEISNYYYYVELVSNCWDFKLK